jgi:hypothetical protein
MAAASDLNIRTTLLGYGGSVGVKTFTWTMALRTHL